MNFYQIFLRGVPDCYTWHFDKKIEIGTRVAVKFRNREKIGIVVEKQEKTPTFKTQPILEVFQNWHINKKQLEFAKELAPNYFVPFSKFLNLLIPEEFLKQKNPVKKEIFYTINQ